MCLTHWGRVTHICVSNLTIIGSDNDLSPGRRQAIIWTNAEMLLIGPLGTNFIEILIEVQAFSFKKMHLKMSSAKWRPFCLGLNVLMYELPCISCVCFDIHVFIVFPCLFYLMINRFSWKKTLFSKVSKKRASAAKPGIWGQCRWTVL